MPVQPDMTAFGVSQQSLPRTFALWSESLIKSPGSAALHVARVQQTQRIAGNFAVLRMARGSPTRPIGRKISGGPASGSQTVRVQRDAPGSPSVESVEGDAASQESRVRGDASTQADDLDRQRNESTASLQGDADMREATLQDSASLQGGQLDEQAADQGAALQNQGTTQGAQLNRESAMRGAALQQEAGSTSARLQGSAAALETDARATEASTKNRLDDDVAGMQDEAQASADGVQDQSAALETQATGRVTSMTARTQALVDQKTALVKEYEAPGAHDPERFHRRWRDLQAQIAPLEQEQSNLDRIETEGQSLGERAGTIWTTLTNRAQALMRRISGVAGNAWAALQRRWSSLQGAAAAAVAALKGKAGAAVSALTALAVGAWNGLQGVATQAWTGLMGVTTGIWTGLQSAATAAWTALQGQATAAWTTLKGITKTAVDSLSTKIDGIVNRISGAIGRVIDAVTSVVSSVLSRLRRATGSALEFLRSRAAAAWQSVKGAGTRAWQGLKRVGTQAWEGAKRLGTRAWNGLKNLGNRAWQGLKDVGTRAWNGLKNLGQRAWNGLKSGWDWVKKKAQAAWKWLMGAWETAKRKASEAWDWIKRKAKQAVAWLKTKWAWLKALVRKGLAWLKAKWKWLKGLVKIRIRIPDQTLCKLRNFKPWKFVDIKIPRIPIVKTVVDPGIGPVELALFVQPSAEATVGGTIGPCTLKNIEFTLQPLISRYTGQADFHVPATARETLKLTGTIGGTANYGGLIALAGGGLEGRGSATALASFGAKPRFVYDAGKISTTVPLRLEFCLMPTIDLDAFVIAQLIAGAAPAVPAPSPAPLLPGPSPLPTIPGAPGTSPRSVPTLAAGPSRSPSARPPPEEVLKEWKKTWRLGSWSRRECWEATATYSLAVGPGGLPDVDLQFSAKPVSLNQVVQSLFDLPPRGEDEHEIASKKPIPCDELPDTYEFSTLEDALGELSDLTGMDRKKMRHDGKRATRGPCSASSGYATGMHYTVKNTSSGEVIGSIGMCPCITPGGGEAKRYAILNHIDATMEEVNQMRVQLQQGNNHIEDAVRQNKPEPGVTVAHLRGGLNELFADGKGKIPSRLESAFLGAVARSSAAYGKYPPSGVCAGGNFWREKFPDKEEGPYRVDSENLRGCNLRE